MLPSINRRKATKQELDNLLTSTSSTPSNKLDEGSSTNNDSLAAAHLQVKAYVEDAFVSPGTEQPAHGSPGHVPSTGLSSQEAEALLADFGRNELEEKVTPIGIVYLQQLWGPMPIMLWCAIVIEIAIQNWVDFAILLVILFTNATLSWYETIKARNAVAALQASLRPTATAKRDGTWQVVDAAVLVPGDLVLLASGSAVPADCMVNHGHIDVDQSALTGESLPVTIHTHQPVLMGGTVTRGEVEATVTATGTRTFFGKTAVLIQSVRSEGNLQRVLMRVMVTLLVASFVLCAVALVYLLAVGEGFRGALEYTITLLVASIPLAIEIVCTTTLAIGSRDLAKQGAIVARLTSIEELAGMNILCSDKTGTLTLNTMVIQDDCPTFTPNTTKHDVLTAAALATKWMEPPKDALDTMVLGAVDHDALTAYQLVDHMPFDPTIKRTESTVKKREGSGVFKVTKGAPHVVLQLVEDVGGLHVRVQATVDALGRRGIRALAVAQTTPHTTPTSTTSQTTPHTTSQAVDTWQLLGVLTFLDPPRPDSKTTIQRALAYGVDVKMITGDHHLIAQETCGMLGMGTTIHTAEHLPDIDMTQPLPRDLHTRFGSLILQADGFAQVFPEHKFMLIAALQQGGFACGMTGDGVNDAPALKRADVGIAVSGCTDAARAAADIVLTEPGLSVIVDALVVARCIFQRIYNFFNYRIAATLQLLLFFFIALFAFPPDSFPINPQDSAAGIQPTSYFQLPVLMLMLITLLNDGTLISVAYDRVTPSERPEKWNLKVLFLTSSVLASVACGSSLLLLWGALDSNSPSGWFQSWGLPGLQYGQVVTMMYLKVSVSDFLTLFSSRTKRFFFSNAPAWPLLAAACFSLALSTLLACVWPPGSLNDIPVMGLTRGAYTLWPLWVWLYCLLWWVIQDLCKAATYALLFRYNLLGAAQSTVVPLRAAHEHTGAAHGLGPGHDSGAADNTGAMHNFDSRHAFGAHGDGDVVVELTQGSGGDGSGGGERGGVGMHGNGASQATAQQATAQQMRLVMVALKEEGLLGSDVAGGVRSVGGVGSGEGEEEVVGGGGRKNKGVSLLGDAPRSDDVV